jgi:putative restriction endonuclease
MDLENFDRSHDAWERTAAFSWLTTQVDRYGDVLPRTVLAQGLELNGQRVPLLGPQGIFKPAIMQVPLSFTTSPNGPYHDAFDAGASVLRYRYRGTDPRHRDNVGLRFAWREQLPLVYFHGLEPGKYLAVWPAFIVDDAPQELTFLVKVDDAAYAGLAPRSEWSGAEDPTIRRDYVTTTVRRRIHQRAFRERVLSAYQRKCALCRLKHAELLDAAHIIPDADPDGEPVVSNGMALCQLHHSAFDKFFIGITPEYRVEVRPDIMEETDGPTLKHAIQALHGTRISVPRRLENRPDLVLLERRYDRFLEAATRP